MNRSWSTWLKTGHLGEEGEELIPFGMTMGGTALTAASQAAQVLQRQRHMPKNRCKQL